MTKQMTRAKFAESARAATKSGVMTSRVKQVNKIEGEIRHYSFAFFLGGLITILGGFAVGFILGVLGIF